MTTTKRNNGLSAVDTPIQVYHQWGDLSRGDHVTVKGWRGGEWHFIAYCTNTSSGDSWVALYGGSKDPTGVRGFRYVNPDRVRRK